MSTEVGLVAAPGATTLHGTHRVVSGVGSKSMASQRAPAPAPASAPAVKAEAAPSVAVIARRSVAAAGEKSNIGFSEPNGPDHDSGEALCVVRVPSDGGRLPKVQTGPSSQNHSRSSAATGAAAAASAGPARQTAQPPSKTPAPRPASADPRPQTLKFNSNGGTSDRSTGNGSAASPLKRPSSASSAVARSRQLGSSAPALSSGPPPPRPRNSSSAPNADRSAQPPAPGRPSDSLPKAPKGTKIAFAHIDREAQVLVDLQKSRRKKAAERHDEAVLFMKRQETQRLRAKSVESARREHATTERSRRLHRLEEERRQSLAQSVERARVLSARHRSTGTHETAPLAAARESNGDADADALRRASAASPADILHAVAAQRTELEPLQELVKVKRIQSIKRVAAMLIDRFHLLSAHLSAAPAASALEAPSSSSSPAGAILNTAHDPSNSIENGTEAKTGAEPKVAANAFPDGGHDDGDATCDGSGCHLQQDDRCRRSWASSAPSSEGSIPEPDTVYAASQSTEKASVVPRNPPIFHSPEERADSLDGQDAEVSREAGADAAPTRSIMATEETVVLSSGRGHPVVLLDDYGPPPGQAPVAAVASEPARVSSAERELDWGDDSQSDGLSFDAAQAGASSPLRPSPVPAVPKSDSDPGVDSSAMDGIATLIVPSAEVLDLSTSVSVSSAALRPLSSVSAAAAVRRTVRAVRNKTDSNNMIAILKDKLYASAMRLDSSSREENPVHVRRKQPASGATTTRATGIRHSSASLLPVSSLTRRRARRSSAEEGGHSSKREATNLSSSQRSPSNFTSLVLGLRPNEHLLKRAERVLRREPDRHDGGNGHASADGLGRLPEYPVTAPADETTVSSSAQSFDDLLRYEGRDAAASTAEPSEETRDRPLLPPPQAGPTSASADVSAIDSRIPRRDNPVMSTQAVLRPRLSPSALYYKMLAQVDLLNSISEAENRIEDLERTKAVAEAQQEAVTLAQVLHWNEMKLRYQEELTQLRSQLREETDSRFEAIRTQIERLKKRDAAVDAVPSPATGAPSAAAAGHASLSTPFSDGQFLHVSPTASAALSSSDGTGCDDAEGANPSALTVRRVGSNEGQRPSKVPASASLALTTVVPESTNPETMPYLDRFIAVAAGAQVVVPLPKVAVGHASNVEKRGETEREPVSAEEPSTAEESVSTASSAAALVHDSGSSSVQDSISVDVSVSSSAAVSVDRDSIESSPGAASGSTISDTVPEVPAEDMEDTIADSSPSFAHDQRLPSSAAMLDATLQSVFVSTSSASDAAGAVSRPSVAEVPVAVEDEDHTASVVSEDLDSDMSGSSSISLSTEKRAASVKPPVGAAMASAVVAAVASGGRDPVDEYSVDFENYSLSTSRPDVSETEIGPSRSEHRQHPVVTSRGSAEDSLEEPAVLSEDLQKERRQPVGSVGPELPERYVQGDETADSIADDIASVVASSELDGEDDHGSLSDQSDAAAGEGDGADGHTAREEQGPLVEPGLLVATIAQMGSPAEENQNPESCSEETGASYIDVVADISRFNLRSPIHPLLADDSDYNDDRYDSQDFEAAPDQTPVHAISRAESAEAYSGTAVELSLSGRSVENPASVAEEEALVVEDDVRLSDSNLSTTVILGRSPSVGMASPQQKDLEDGEQLGLAVPSGPGKSSVFPQSIESESPLLEMYPVASPSSPMSVSGSPSVVADRRSADNVSADSAGSPPKQFSTSPNISIVSEQRQDPLSASRMDAAAAAVVVVVALQVSASSDVGTSVVSPSSSMVSDKLWLSPGVSLAPVVGGDGPDRARDPSPNPKLSPAAGELPHSDHQDLSPVAEAVQTRQPGGSTAVLAPHLERAVEEVCSSLMIEVLIPHALDMLSLLAASSSMSSVPRNGLLTAAKDAAAPVEAVLLEASVRSRDISLVCDALAAGMAEEAVSEMVGVAGALLGRSKIVSTQHTTTVDDPPPTSSAEAARRRGRHQRTANTGEMGLVLDEIDLKADVAPSPPPSAGESNGEPDDDAEDASSVVLHDSETEDPAALETEESPSPRTFVDSSWPAVESYVKAILAATGLAGLHVRPGTKETAILVPPISLDVFLDLEDRRVPETVQIFHKLLFDLTNESVDAFNAVASGLGAAAVTTPLPAQLSGRSAMIRVQGSLIQFVMEHLQFLHGLRVGTIQDAERLPVVEMKARGHEWLASGFAGVPHVDLVDATCKVADAVCDDLLLDLAMEWLQSAL